MATLPKLPPVHRGLSRGELLSYIADYAMRLSGRSPALPTLLPAHRGLSRGELLSYIADYSQP